MFITGALLLIFSLLFAVAPTNETTSWINLNASKQQGYLGLSRIHPDQIKLMFNADNLKRDTIGNLFSWGNLQILRNNSALILSLSDKDYIILTQTFDIENLDEILINFQDGRLIVISKINDNSKIVALDSADTLFSSGYWKVYQDNSPSITAISVLPQAYRISNTKYRSICLLIICFLNFFLFIQQNQRLTTSFDKNAK